MRVAALVAVSASCAPLEVNRTPATLTAHEQVEMASVRPPDREPVPLFTAAASVVKVETPPLRIASLDPPAAPPSGLLPSGFHNPMPGGVLAGYAADTGLDVAGSPRPVYAIAAGTLDYSEAGHTLWTGRRDSHFTIRFELDAPIAFGERSITHVYYGHLSKLAFEQHEGAAERKHFEGGAYLGESGVARGSPHLHIGLLLDGDVSQDWGTFLSAKDVARVLGFDRNGIRLPKDERRN